MERRLPAIRDSHYFFLLPFLPFPYNHPCAPVRLAYDHSPPPAPPQPISPPPHPPLIQPLRDHGLSPNISIHVTDYDYGIFRLTAKIDATRRYLTTNRTGTTGISPS